MQLLGRDHRKPVRQIKPHLMAKHGARARAGPVGLFSACISDPAHQVMILLHERSLLNLGGYSNKLSDSCHSTLMSLDRRLALRSNWLMPIGGE